MGRSPLGGGFGRLSGGGPLTAARSSLASSAPLATPGSWRRLLRWAALLAIPLLIVALVLISDSLSSEPPRVPEVAVKPPRPAPPSAPGVDVPTPDVRVPTPDLRAPSVATPDFPAPSPGPTPQPAGSDEPPASTAPDRPETFHRLTVNHIHRLRIVWLWDWIAIGLLTALFFLLLRPLARRQARDRYARAAAITLAALALSGFAVSAGVKQMPGEGRYEPHPRFVVDEHRNSDGDLIVEEEKPVDHYHPPLHLDVVLLLLAAVLADLSVPSGRIAVEGFNRWTRSRRRRATRQRPS